VLFFASGSLQVQAQGDCGLSKIIDDSPVKGASWSVTVLDEQGEMACNLNSAQLITPASNLKLYTLGSILKELGPDYTFKTRIIGDGEAEGSVWIGDLIVIGSGDPSISGDLYEGDPYYVFRNLLGQLKAAGITKVEGAVLGYNGLFDEDKYPKGWDWDDLSFYYGVEIDALSFNNNAIDIEVYADGAIGEKPRLEVFPEKLNGITLINDQVIAEGDTEYDEYYRRELGRNVIHLRSSLPEGYLEKESLSVYNGAFFFISSFVDFLEENGIEVREDSKEDHVLNTLMWVEKQTELAIHESKPLSELLKWAMKESDNFYTEMLLKTMVAEKVSNPASFEDGIQLVRAFAAEMGADSSFIKMKDGSGMASGTLSSSGDLAVYLHNYRKLDEYPYFKESLSVAGIDGTLAYRFRSSPIQNRFLGKSGFMSGVRTLSGYLQTRDGEELIVSIATNHFVEKVKVVDAVHEDILEHLYSRQ
jgi:D-alanyl-D-alanine carboxypeptidase/D-alanyl-D-alanine-endopeptidase (penicillin-binding protein 4)